MSWEIVSCNSLPLINCSGVRSLSIQQLVSSVGELVGCIYIYMYLAIHPNIYKSTLPDLLNPRILRTLEDKLVGPLTHCLTIQWHLSYSWRLESSKCNCNSQEMKETRNWKLHTYKPDSIVCKIMMRLVKETLISYLKVITLISDSQHPFRNKSSCLTNILDFFAQVIDICIWHIQ